MVSEEQLTTEERKAGLAVSDASKSMFGKQEAGEVGKSVEFLAGTVAGDQLSYPQHPAETFEGFRVRYDNKGYPCINVDNNKIRLHILVWERVNGKKPQGYDIHHRDGNKRNYFLDNLDLLSKSDHKRLHAGWVRQNGKWIAKPCKKCGKILLVGCFYLHKSRGTLSTLCKICSSRQIIEMRNISPEKKAEFLKSHHEAKRRYRLRLKMEGKKALC